MRISKAGTCTKSRQKAPGKWLKGNLFSKSSPLAISPVLPYEPQQWKRIRNSLPLVGGFTLIELVVVLVIISIVALLVYPKLSPTSQSDLRSAARSLAATIRYVEDRGVATKNVYRMKINLDEASVSVTQIASDGSEEAADDVELRKKMVLVDGITIADIDTSRLGKVAAGEVDLDFGPLGLGEFISIHLRAQNGSYFTVQAYPRTGRVRVFDNYSGGTV
jgi:general secretion pathway protein H